jgi:uncharacterized membrane protein
MHTRHVLIATAVATALSLPLITIAQRSPAPQRTVEVEKCYGIAKAGRNDCHTAQSFCAGTSKQDGQGDAWIYVPAGTCGKIVGGSTEPKKS